MKKNRIIVKCNVCEKNIERVPSDINICKSKKFYCSMKCRGIGRRNSYFKKCKICGKKFKTIPALDSNYCSIECVGKGKITGRNKKCEQCGKEFWCFKSEEKRGRKYCSEKCSQLASRSKGYFDSIVMRKNYGKEWSKKVKKRDNYICQKCNSKKELHAHHILSFGDYPEERFNVDNGITLCRDCHLKVHKELI